jgi:hypothetical protein
MARDRPLGKEIAIFISLYIGNDSKRKNKIARRRKNAKTKNGAWVAAVNFIRVTASKS